MPLRAKSRGKYVSVDWASVGRRIREIRGFDMTPTVNTAIRFVLEMRNKTHDP